MSLWQRYLHSDEFSTSERTEMAANHPEEQEKTMKNKVNPFCEFFLTPNHYYFSNMNKVHTHYTHPFQRITGNITG